MLIFLLSAAPRLIPDFIATNLVVLITANLSVVLCVQMVLVINKVVHAIVNVVVVLLLLVVLIATSISVVVLLVLQVGHLVGLASVVQEDRIGNRPLSLALERWQVLQVVLSS